MYENGETERERERVGAQEEEKGEVIIVYIYIHAFIGWSSCRYVIPFLLLLIV